MRFERWGLGGGGGWPPRARAKIMCPRAEACPLLDGLKPSWLGGDAKPGRFLFRSITKSMFQPRVDKSLDVGLEPGRLLLLSHQLLRNGRTD